MFSDTHADFTFSSFRKFFPVPDGAWHKVKDKSFRFNEKGVTSLFSNKKLIGGIIKYFSLMGSVDELIYLKYLEEGEIELENYQTITGISKESISILSNLSNRFNEIIRKRNANDVFVLEQLDRFEIETLFPVTAPVNAPLAIPIKIKGRDIVRKRMAENKIYLPVHWQVPSEFADTLTFGNKIAQNELSLVIDRRYSPILLQKIFDVLNECKADKIF